MRRSTAILCVILLLTMAGCAANGDVHVAQPSESTAASIPAESTVPAGIPETTEMPAETLQADTTPVETVPPKTQPPVSQQPTENAGSGTEEVQGQFCITCGEWVAIWEMFEGECFDCNPYGGMDPAECGTCQQCGEIRHNSNLYNGVCTICDPNGMYDEGPERCSECGRSGVYISRYGYCDDCYFKNHAGEYGYCAVCEYPLTSVEAASYDGTRCFGCVGCDSCGGYISYDTFDPGVGYICSDCNRPTCRSCGTELYEGGDYDGYCYYCHPDFGFECSQCGIVYPSHPTASGLCPYCEAGYVDCAACGSTVSALNVTDGYCWSCYDYLFNTFCSECGTTYAYAGMEDGVCDTCVYYSTPNVFCPQCGYSWFETGVGVEGFFCPECGCNF